MHAFLSQLVLVTIASHLRLSESVSRVWNRWLCDSFSITFFLICSIATNSLLCSLSELVINKSHGGMFRKSTRIGTLHSFWMLGWMSGCTTYTVTSCPRSCSWCAMSRIVVGPPYLRRWGEITAIFLRLGIRSNVSSKSLTKSTRRSERRCFLDVSCPASRNASKRLGSLNRRL